jgi:hypothetical protein
MSVHDKAGPLHVLLNIGKNQGVITSARISTHVQKVSSLQMDSQVYVGGIAASGDLRHPQYNQGLSGLTSIIDDLSENIFILGRTWTTPYHPPEM